VEYISIGKQKVVWILKCREQHKEAAGNALMKLINGPTREKNIKIIKFTLRLDAKNNKTRELGPIKNHSTFVFILYFF
jgi:hypothetical protein